MRPPAVPATMPWKPNARDRRVLSELHPDLRRAIEHVLTHVNHPAKLPPGVYLRPHTGYRSPEQQVAAWRRGATTLKRGKHNIRPARACDLVFVVNGMWSWDRRLPWWLPAYWSEHYGLLTGARWGLPGAYRTDVWSPAHPLGWDAPHHEMRGWG